MVIDSNPYVHSGSAVDGSSETFNELKGQLVVDLAAGSHTAVLQWRVLADEKAVPWTTLNRVTLGYQGGEELLMLVNHQSNEPTLVTPLNKDINKTLEDTPTTIYHTYISKIDPSLTSSYRVGIQISANFGVISLATTSSLTFSVGDGIQDEVMYFSGTVEKVDAAINALTYKPVRKLREA